jgi:hypothetical protein
LALLFGLALVIGLAARVKRGEANSRGRAIAGIALGVVVIVVGLALLGRFAAAVYENAQRFRLSHETATTPTTTSPQQTTSPRPTTYGAQSELPFTGLHAPTGVAVDTAGARCTSPTTATIGW